jgi:hypothetical protein
MEIKRSGSQPSGKGPAEYFTGTVRIDPLFQVQDPARASGASGKGSTEISAVRAYTPILAANESSDLTTNSRRAHVAGEPSNESA